MGRSKLDLPLGSRTVLEWTISAFQEAQVDVVLVVLAPHVASLQTIAETAGAHVLLLPSETPEMRTTVQRGLDHIEATFQPAAEDCWLLSPADHPTLDANVIRILVAKSEQQRDRSLFVPVFQERRGHPALIRWSETAALRAWPAGEGLNRFFRSRNDATGEVAVESADVLLDLDTPGDYEALLGRLRPGVR